MKKAAAWVADLIDGTTRVLNFRKGPATASAQSRPKESSRRAAPDFRKRLAEVHRLEAEGVARFEIARRSGLAQDTVGMMLNMASTAAEDPAESAVRGTFFRILQTRITEDNDGSIAA